MYTYDYEGERKILDHDFPICLKQKTCVHQQNHAWSSTLLFSFINCFFRPFFIVLTVCQTVLTLWLLYIYIYISNGLWSYSIPDFLVPFSLNAKGSDFQKYLIIIMVFFFEIIIIMVLILTMVFNTFLIRRIIYIHIHIIYIYIIMIQNTYHFTWGSFASTPIKF